jgi:5'-3' exonuclease
MKGVIQAFGFEWRMVRSSFFLTSRCSADHSKAPGEAEAELAHLNAIGIIDAVLSDDVDNFLFGAKMVIRKCALAHPPAQNILLILVDLAQVLPFQAIVSTP